MTKKVLGKASYHASRVGGITTITATGTLSNMNDKPDFERLPFLIFPPQYAFYIIEKDIKIPTIKPFTYSEIISYPQSASFVSIRDATGLHQIQINEIILPESDAEAPNATDTGYCVFSQIAVDNLLVAKCDAILPAIYTKVFGPATYGECNNYAATHGGQ